MPGAGEGDVRRLRLSKGALTRRLWDIGDTGRTQYCSPGSTPALDDIALPATSVSTLTDAAAASPTGSVLFVTPSDLLLVAPPFAIDVAGAYDRIDTARLAAMLERPRVYAAFLLRLGGFTVGFFRGKSLIASKTDRRFVKNRHRKGGQSQRRFERIREKQVHELFGDACETARETLAPYEREIEHVFLGGDRHTLQAFRKECAYFERYGERLSARLLPVAGDPRRASLDAVPREVWTSDAWVTALAAE